MPSIDLTLTLKRKTPEHTLAVIGFMAMIADRAKFGAEDMGDQDVVEITHVIARGFSAPMVTNQGGENVFDRNSLIRPSLFNIENWATLLVGLTIQTNLDTLTNDNPDDDIYVSVSGDKEDVDPSSFLALVRFLREHHIPVTESTPLFKLTSEDPLQGNYVIALQPDLSITYTKITGDIEQPLDAGWIHESGYSANAQSLMQVLVQQVRTQTNQTTAQLQRLRKKASKEDKLFIQQTGFNKMLLAYYDLVTYVEQRVMPIPGDLPGAEPHEMTVVFIDPGMVTVLGDLFALSVKRVIDSGVLSVVQTKHGKYPFGNRNKLSEISSDLSLLLPSAKVEPVRTAIAQYLSVFA